MSSCYIGIDPGVKGAVSVVYDDDSVESYPVPTVRYKIGKSTKTRIDAPRFYDLIAGIAMTTEPRLVVFEEVGGMPPRFNKVTKKLESQSAPAAFTFGKTTGLMLGAVIAARLPFYEVPPGTWKKRFRLSADKDKCRLVAGQLLPLGQHLWAKSTQDGHAEAALLALYGRDVKPAPKPIAKPRRKRA